MTTTAHTTRLLARSAIAATLLASGAATFLAGSGTALAPAPAKLMANLAGGTGATAEGVYVNSQTTTSVRIWPSSLTYAPNGLAAGTPCSPGGLRSGDNVTTVIVVYPGGYRKCA